MNRPSSLCSSAAPVERRTAACSRYRRRSVRPVAVAIFKKLRRSSAHSAANSASTTAETTSIAAPSPAPTLPNRYSG